MRLVPASPPPGPARPEFWRSPLRGKWLTSFLGVVLLAGMVVVAGTGLLSHAAYQPDLPGNAIVPRGSDFQPFVFDWPTNPAWLYAATQGTHVVLGIALVPLLLAKLWSVAPRLFGWPPIRNLGHALERLSLIGVVGGGLFEVATGILNVQLWYVFHFRFVTAHYYGALVFIAALALHVAVKTPVVLRAFRRHGVLRPLGHSLAATEPEPFEPDGLAPPEPAAPTISRRGLIGLAGAAGGALLVLTAGQAIGGPLRRVALLAPRYGTTGTGPNDFQVNKTFAATGIRRAEVESWALDLRGPRPTLLERSALLRMPLSTQRLPIACVEGWSTTQSWTGVPLRDLAELAGAPDATVLEITSLQKGGALHHVSLNRDQLHDPRSLLALRVNGADLSLDHGFPARIIVPALPGVHNTKWVAALEFVA